MRYERKLSDLLSIVYRNMELDQMADEIEVKNAYYGVVGTLVGRLTLEVKFSKGVLTIKYASAALKAEISYKKQDLVNKMNEVLKRRVVNRIVLI